ncbi:MAG: HU family DNA-binding protein [Methylocella sp.]
MVAKKPASAAKTASAKTVKAKAVKPAAAPRAQAAQATITLKQIGVQLAETHELPKQKVDELFDDMVAVIAKQVKKGAKVRVSGLGIFQVKKRAARKGRNPATGESIKIKASKGITFRIASDLKKAL